MFLLVFVLQMSMTKSRNLPTFEGRRRGRLIVNNLEGLLAVDGNAPGEVHRVQLPRARIRAASDSV